MNGMCDGRYRGDSSLRSSVGLVQTSWWGGGSRLIQDIEISSPAVEGSIRDQLVLTVCRRLEDIFVYIFLYIYF